MTEKPKEDGQYLSPDMIQVRVDDGQVQWHDGTLWHTVCSVEELIEKDRFTVDEMSQRIKSVIAEREHLSFYDLFDDDFTKTEIITTFQSILELMKGQFIHVVQESTFGEITIHKVA